MKIFCRILIYIIIASTLSGCGGGSSGGSSSIKTDPPPIKTDPPSNDPAPSICKDDAKDCLASSLPDTIYVTKDETELYVVNNSSNPITIDRITFSDGQATNTLAGLSIDTETYFPNSNNDAFILPYKLEGTTIDHYNYYYSIRYHDWYGCYIRADYLNNSPIDIIVNYTTKDGKHKTSSIKVSIALAEDLGVKKQLKNIVQLEDKITKNDPAENLDKLKEDLKTLKQKLLEYMASDSLDEKNYYKVLGIPYQSQYSDDYWNTIRKNYHKLGLICHPDKYREAGETSNENSLKAFIKIQKAYNWLEKDKEDKEKKKKKAV